MSIAKKAPHRRFHEWAEEHGYALYIGDASKWRGLRRSVWYNRYHGSRNMSEEERERAVQLFREELLGNDPDDLMAHIPELPGKALGCWCAPLLCHGHVLAELANESIH